MARIYTISFEGIAVSAAQDLFMIAPIANVPIELISLELGQTTELADAEEEQLQIEIIRGNTTVGSGGASVTPARRDIRDSASVATCRRNDTTRATAGSPITLLQTSWNIRSPFLWMPVPEGRFRCDAGQTRITVGLDDAPADSITMYGTLVFQEI